MSSPKQIAANRNNAVKSVGPRSADGKRRASRNAVRHGLSCPLGDDPDMEPKVRELATLLVGEEATAIERDLATMAAAAQLDLARIHWQRHLLLNRAVVGVVVPSTQVVSRLNRFERYERRAQARRKRAMRRLSGLHRLPLFG